MEALSLSRVMRESSASIWSPGETSTSITSTSLKSPMSGSVTSVTLAMAALLTP